MLTEADDGTTLGEDGAGEAGGVVGDEVVGAESGDEAGGDSLAGLTVGSRAECDSSRCFLPTMGAKCRGMDICLSVHL